MYKVILVDDEPHILEGMNYLINWEEYGIEIVGRAASGIEALQMISQEKYVHLLITDVKMPEMSGLQLIHAVKQSHPHIKCIILSGFDDFQYVKEAVKLGIENYLLKPVNREELSSTLLNITEKIENELYEQIRKNQSFNVLKENILYRIITNEIGKEELLQKAQFLHIDLDCSNYIVGIINIIYSSREKENLTIRDKQKLNYAVRNILEEFIGKHQLGTVFSDLSGNLIVLVHHRMYAVDKTAILPVLEQCKSIVSSMLKLDLFITLGSFEQDHEFISKSYDLAKDLQEYQLVYPRNSILFHEDILSLHAQSQQSLTIDYESFNKLLASQKTESLMLFIDQVFEQFKQGAPITPAHVQNITMEMFIQVRNTAKQLAKNNHYPSFEYKALISGFKHLQNADELHSWLKKITLSAVNILADSDERMNPAIKQILYYIHHNYSKDISIKMLSANFNINAAYLGQLFKEETGEILSNFLLKLRMEQAKQLLIHTRLKAGEIALEVGYNEANYFYKAFKKHAGISVSEFRNKFGDGKVVE